MKKKVLSLLILLCMVTALLPVNMINVSAYNGTKYGNYLYYTISGGKVTISDCDSSATEIRIPSTIDYCPVTNIGNNAFSDCSSLASITIPSGVTSIGEYAFSGCSKLTGITIPSGVSSIGNSAFYNCYNLKYVTIPDSVTSIGDYTFYYCSSLISIKIPNGVTTVGNYTFRYCFDLRSITIPDSVISIGEGAFYSCNSLINVTIPDGVTSIGESAFCGCSSLTNVTIPDGVTSISEGVFCYCSGLRSITIPDGVTSIGRDAFGGCSSLTSITIPDGVTSIEHGTFSACSSLTNITIPDRVTSIGGYAFNNCSNLKTVYYHGTENEWKNINIGNYNTCLKNAKRTYFAYVTLVDESNVAKHKVVLNSCVDVDKAGYTPHIYKDKELTNEFDISMPITEDITLYLKYVINKYSYKFVDEDGNVLKEDTVDFDTVITAPTNPVKKATQQYTYTFIGWDGFYTGITQTDETMVFTAKYKETINKYTYKFVDEDGTVLKEETSNYGTTIIPPETPKDKDPLTFDYWKNYTDNMSVESNIIFNAIYKYKKYTITISELEKSQEVTYGDSYTLPVRKIKNFEFKGYYTEENGKGVKLTDENGKSIENYAFAEDKTVYPYYAFTNKVMITGTDNTQPGTENVLQTISFATDKDASVLYAYIKYPVGLTLKSVTAKDFEYVEKEDEYTENGYTIAVIVAQYSDTELIPKNELLTPFELTFDVSKTAECGTYQIEITEESCLVGNETHNFEERIFGSLEINPKLAESIEIVGNTEIFSATTYTATILPEYTTDKTVEWFVDKPEVTTVDENGIVTPVTSGTVILTAKTKDGSNLSGTKTITITKGVESIEIIGSESVTAATTYTVNVSPYYATNKEVEWSIDKPEIATINQNGILTPLTSGIVTVTAKAKDGSEVSTSKTITVIKLAEKVEITGESSISSPAQYTAIVTPNYTSDKSVVWSVDKENIAKVDENGIVTPVTSGTIVLTAEAADGSGASDTKNIEIIKYAESIEIIGESEITEETQYSVVILPDYTTDKNAQWTVSDESVATVDENGVVTPLKNGKIVLTATATDKSGVGTTKSITVTVSVRANSITSDIGVWDKEFDSDITDYTIYVPKNATAVYLTSRFENASAKINGSIMSNGIKKRITLNSERDTIELVLTPTNGNTLKSNTYTFTVVKFEGTKTDVSTDKKSFTVKPINIASGNTVILALYNESGLVEMQEKPCSGEDIPFTTDKAYTSAKVMVWDSKEGMKPICEAEKVE